MKIRDNQQLKIAIVALLLVASIPWLWNLAIGHTIEVKVVYVEAFANCYRSGPPASDVRLNPLSKNTRLMFGECGGVRTENGSYKLPSSAVRIGPMQSRETIIAKLKDGCTYRVRVVGFGGPQDHPKTLFPNARQQIWRVLDEVSCG